MRIAMVCHAAPEIGGGHLIRCVALAEEATGRGHEVTIVGDVGRHPLAHAASAVSHVFPTANTVRSVRSALNQVAPDLVHVDSYGEVSLSSSWLTSSMRDGVFGTSPTNLVIDPTPGRTADPKAGLLAGSEFAPLRHAISTRRGSWRRPGTGRVLVTMGSTDPMGISPHIVRTLLDHEIGLQITVLGGVDNHDVFDDHRVTTIAHTGDFGSLALECDLAVSASGTTVLELACLGVPMAIVCAVPNQRVAYDHLTLRDSAIGLGSPNEWSVVGIDMLTQRWQEPERLAAQAAVAARLVDGFGSERIVQAWERLSTRRSAGRSGWAARAATNEDARVLFDWRNDPVARANSRTQGAVSWNDHLAWLERSLHTEDRLLLVIEDHNREPTGTVRWDHDTRDEWEVSINVAPERRGHGVGAQILSLAETALSRSRGECTAVAVVHASNEASVRLFVSAGYRASGPSDHDGFRRFLKPLATA